MALVASPVAADKEARVAAVAAVVAVAFVSPDEMPTVNTQHCWNTVFDMQGLAAFHTLWLVIQGTISCSQAFIKGQRSAQRREL